MCAAPANRGDHRAQSASRGPSRPNARGAASGPAEGVAPVAQWRPRSAQDRGRLGADRLVALQHRRLRAGVEGDGREQDQTRDARVSGLRPSIGGPAGAAQIVAIVRGAAPICLTWHPTRTGLTSTDTRSEPDPERRLVAVRVSRTALGRRRRCPSAQSVRGGPPHVCDPDGARSRVERARRPAPQRRRGSGQDRGAMRVATVEQTLSRDPM